MTQPAAQPDPGPGFDHSHRQWAALLQRYVAGGMVRYRAWAADPGGLDAYIQSLSAVTAAELSGFSDAQKLAFWINAYNAFTIQIILDHYPIRSRLLSAAPDNSIKQIEDVWDDFYLVTAGDRFSLNRIEHDILRKEFREPRIHVAINCASRGCPPLRHEPYVADRLDRQLDDQSRRFARNPTQVRLDRDRRVLHVSKVFSWFGDDFVGEYSWSGPGPREGVEAAVLGFVHAHLPPGDRSYLETTAVEIRYLDWDWTLNEAEES
jgi:hypothetical protein